MGQMQAVPAPRLRLPLVPACLRTGADFDFRTMMLDQHNLESVRISVCASQYAEYSNFDDLYSKSTFNKEI